MNTNILVPLPGFVLPPDLPWRVRFIQLVNEHLERLHAERSFQPPRFFGYYFRGTEPIAVSGSWTVALDPAEVLTGLPDKLELVTCGQFNITATDDGDPDYLLVHDRRDGASWLWGFAYGLRFVTATSPLLDTD